MCIDFRGLNAITVKHRYFIPNIEDLLLQLKGASYFTELDMTSGYHQVAIWPSDRPKTAFVTTFGTFEWHVLPFWLCNGPSHFMRMMNKLLQKGRVRNFVVVYLDDILILSKTQLKHREHVAAVLEVLKHEGFKLQPNKCFFEWRGIVRK